MVCIATAQSMHPLAEVAVVVRLWLDETVERVNHPATPYYDQSHGADTRRVLVGRFKVDGDEVANHVSYISLLLSRKSF